MRRVIIVIPMELLLRFVALFVVSFVVALSSWIVARHLKPGLPRLAACSPLFLLSVVPSTLFDRQRSSEAILYYYCVLNYVWLLNCKLVAMAMNRGPLMTHRHRPVLFTWLLIFPINVKASTASHKSQECNSPKSVLISFLTKVIGCVFFARLVVAFWEYGLVRDFSLSWLMYCLLTAVMELVAYASLVILNIELMPHFDRPWKTTSISEFWSARWNLVVGALLRDLVYEPIMEGMLIKREIKAKSTVRRPLRQMVAVLGTFVMSGLMHWAVIYFILQIHAWFNFASFCIHGIVVVSERCASVYLRKHPQLEAKWTAVPRTVKAVVVQAALHLIAHNFFWHELVHCKETWDLATALDILH